MTGRSPLDRTSPFTESNRRPSPYHGDALPTELRGRGRRPTALSQVPTEPITDVDADDVMRLIFAATAGIYRDDAQRERAVQIILDGIRPVPVTSKPRKSVVR